MTKPLLDEPLLWFGVWLLLLAAWMLLTAFITRDVTTAVIAATPTLAAALVAPLWMPHFLDWYLDRRRGRHD